MIDLKIDVNLNGVDKELRDKGGKISTKAQQLNRDIIDIAQRWVKNDAPRKTGRLKTSIDKTITSFGGSVFRSLSIAPYGDFVIDGTNAHEINAKNGKALFWSGASHPVKRVYHPGTKSNPFFDRAYGDMQGEIDDKIAVFEKWLEA